MRILIIRHGDPDYEHDSLTEKGFREAELVAKRFEKERFAAIYCSTNGRAMKTCEPTAKLLGIEPKYRDWLREVPFCFDFPGYRDRKYWFSYPPQAWDAEPAMESVSEWDKAPFFAQSGIRAHIDNVNRQLDAILSSYGWSRRGHYYHMLPDCQDVAIAFFCHQGLGTALIAHLCSLPVAMLWNTSMTPTSSVSTIVMDKIRTDEPISVARMISMGDTSHLYAAGMDVNWRGLHHEITP